MHNATGTRTEGESTSVDGLTVLSTNNLPAPYIHSSESNTRTPSTGWVSVQGHNAMDARYFWSLGNLCCHYEVVGLTFDIFIAASRI